MGQAGSVHTGMRRRRKDSAGFPDGTVPLAEQYAAVELFRGTMVLHSVVVYRDDSPAARNRYSSPATPGSTTCPSHARHDSAARAVASRGGEPF